MNTRIQLLCAWSGVGLAVLFCAGFAIAGFIPPPSPNLSAQEITEIYRDDNHRIRGGLLLTTFATPLIGLWTAVISVQMRRIEGRHSALSYAQIILGTCLLLEFLFPILVWQAAAYRTERSAELIGTLNDLGWLQFMASGTTVLLQAAVIGLIILRDERAEPLIPRWCGFFSLWAVLLFCPACLVVLVQDGPLAWDGIFSWWLAVSSYLVWMVVLTWALLRAIKRQAGEEAARRDDDTQHDEHGDYQVLVAEIAELRSRLDAVTPNLSRRE